MDWLVNLFLKLVKNESLARCKSKGQHRKNKQSQSKNKLNKSHKIMTLDGYL